MAKVFPANLAPDAYPRVRGVVITRMTEHGAIIQSWPKKRGKPKDWTTQFLSQQFAIAARMAANAEPMEYQTAVFLTQGSTWLPRDLLVRARYGKAYEIYMPDGTLMTQASHAAPSDEPVYEWQTSADAVLGTNDTGWAGYTLRQRIEASVLLGFDATATRITLKASPSAGALNIIAAYVGQGASSGDTYDFAATPVQLAFGGLTSVTIPQGGELASDAAAYTMPSGANLVVSVACGSPSSLARASSEVGWASFYKFGNDAATVNATGYTSYVNAIGVALVETLHLVP